MKYKSSSKRRENSVLRLADGGGEEVDDDFSLTINVIVSARQPLRLNIFLSSRCCHPRRRFATQVWHESAKKGGETTMRQSQSEIRTVILNVKPSRHQLGLILRLPRAWRCNE
jgi:hypothetical protein